MTMRNATLLLLMTLVLAVPGGAARAADGAVVIDRVVAVVNDDIITLSDLQRELQNRRDTTDERVVLEEMIDRKLILSAAKRTGLDVTERELDEAVADIMRRNNMDRTRFESALSVEGLTFEQYRSELREQMTLSRLVNKYVRSGITVDEAEARAYYERNPRQYSLPEEIRVRHLVVTVPPAATAGEAAAAKERAAALMAQLERGDDFIALIRKHSGGPTAALDGDLGFLPRGQVLPEIEEATRGIRAGEYAGPVRSADGFHLIRLEEVRTPLVPFEKVRDEIIRMLSDQKMQNAYRAWLQTLRYDAHIENRL